MSVDTPLKDYEDMQKSWELPLDLMAGTTGMRKAGKKWLPQELKESDAAYKNRLERTVLYNVFRKTAHSLKGQSFMRPVVVTQVPEQLKYLIDNIDGMGTTITDFAAQLFLDVLVYGKEHSVTDFPVTDSANMSITEFRELKAYATRLNPENVIGWRVDSNSGHEELTELRVREDHTILTDKWEEETLEQIKVWTKDSITTYEKDTSEGGSGEFEFLTAVPNTLGYIPVTVSYGEKLGFFKAKSPLEDLAWLNVRHWQSQSDQNNILHVARVPFIFGSGFEEGELSNAEIGANRLIVSSNPEATLGYVEHTGQAINAGRNDLLDLEKQMATMGADLIMTKGVSRQTATARQIDLSESLSIVQIILRAIEATLKGIFKTAGEYMDITGADDVSISIGDDLNLPNEPNPTQAVITLLQALDLTEEEILRELKRRGLISSSLQQVALNKPDPVAPPVVVDGEEQDDEDANEEAEPDGASANTNVE